MPFTFKYGPYKDYLLREVPLDYLKWLADNTKNNGLLCLVLSEIKMRGKLRMPMTPEEQAWVEEQKAKWELGQEGG